MLDFDLELLYETETCILKQAVRRNLKRFPLDFMFLLTKQEVTFMVSQSVIPSWKSLGGALHYVFTEQGVAMLSTVLKSEKAIELNIAIMRTFVKLRKYINQNKEIFERLEKLETGFESLGGMFTKVLIQETKPKRKMVLLLRKLI